MQAEEKSKKERFVLSVAYSPDGLRLACGAMDGGVYVFDTASGKLLHALEGHYKPVRSLTFTPGLLPARSCSQSINVWGLICTCASRLTSCY